MQRIRKCGKNWSVMFINYSNLSAIFLLSSILIDKLSKSFFKLINLWQNSWNFLRNCQNKFFVACFDVFNKKYTLHYCMCAYMCWVNQPNLKFSVKMNLKHAAITSEQKILLVIVGEGKMTILNKNVNSELELFFSHTWQTRERLFEKKSFLSALVTAFLMLNCCHW